MAVTRRFMRKALPAAIESAEASLESKAELKQRKSAGDPVELNKRLNRA